ncbi:hypothetical protein [Desulfurobacterium sp.]
MAVYICKNCGSVVESNTTPHSAGCPKGGGHFWIKACPKGGITPKVGTHPYQCKKCGITIYCSTTPTSAGCPKGGGHIWLKL